MQVGVNPNPTGEKGMCVWGVFETMLDGVSCFSAYWRFSTSWSGCSSSITLKNHDREVTAGVSHPSLSSSSTMHLIHNLLASLALVALHLAASADALPYLDLGKVGSCRG